MRLRQMFCQNTLTANWLIYLLFVLQGGVSDCQWQYGVAVGNSSTGSDSVTSEFQTIPLIGSASKSVVPTFDDHTTRRFKAQLGSRAFFTCVVQNLGDISISWVRNRDSALITVNQFTYISDPRFQCLHTADTDTWTLRLLRVKASDAGRYECQVGTKPKKSQYYHLEVIEPTVQIFGGERERFVNAGSAVSLECRITNTIEKPDFVFWYLNGETLATDQKRLYIRLTTMPDASMTSSVVVIDPVDQSDSGNYTCRPSNLTPVNVTLHVLNGEHHAAMHNAGVRLKSIFNYHYELPSCYDQIICQYLTCFLLMTVQHIFLQ